MLLRACSCVCRSMRLSTTRESAGIYTGSLFSFRASRVESRQIPRNSFYTVNSLAKPQRLYTTSTHNEVNIISKKELQSKINKSPNEFYLFDVREPHETAQGTIPTAKLLPLGTAFAALTNTELDWEEAFGFPRPDLNDEVIFYCRSGKRSYQACMLAKQMGFKNVKNYEGSWLEWSGQ